MWCAQFIRGKQGVITVLIGKLDLQNMQTDPDLEPYQRRDIQHANPAERPSQEEYDKYISIVKFGRDHDWDQKVLTNRGPFLMADPGIFFIC